MIQIAFTSQHMTHRYALLVGGRPTMTHDYLGEPMRSSAEDNQSDANCLRGPPRLSTAPTTAPYHCAQDESQSVLKPPSPRPERSRSSKEDGLWIWKFQENDMYLELEDEARE